MISGSWTESASSHQLARFASRRSCQLSRQGVLYLPPSARFKALLELPEGGEDEQTPGQAVDEAMRRIEAANPQLSGVLPKTYQGFNARLLKQLLKNFSTIPVDLEGDSFGKIYEYFLAEFALTEGQGGGEFYTPTAIVRLMVEILEPFGGRVLDPACGSGGMFVQSARFVREHEKAGRPHDDRGIALHGVEKVDDTGRLCRMNLAVHGLEGDIRHGGELNSYYDDPHDLVGRFDFVLANPPFNVDMAVVVSPGQNEIEDMKKLGLDIVPHRRRMVESKLDDRFKDPADPLALVFVCAMWLTGFDAPSCSTIYLDKPMRNHSLMQAIARANRVYPGKHAGVIVDYANVFESLERALSIYGPGGGASRHAPAHTKDALLDELARLLDALVASCRALGVDLAAIEAAKPLERLERVDRAASTLLVSEERRKDFVGQVRLVLRVFAAIKPHARATEFNLRCSTLRALLDKIHEITTTPVDVDEVLRRIGQLLGRSIAAIDIVEDAPHVDLAQIDFQALAAKFKRSPVQGLDLARLQTAIRAQLDRMVAANPTRVDLHERFEALIDAYNRGSAGREQLFADLLALSRTLSEEQTRHVREQLSDEELVVFDLLTRPGPELTSAQRNQVKQVARDLLAKVHTSLRLDWHKTTQSRAAVLEAIEETLDEGLPEPYTPELFRAKSGTIFQHVYERYGA